MRISDWSSDVCSSDLQRHILPEQFGRQIEPRGIGEDALAQRDRPQIGDVPLERHLVIRSSVDIFEQEVRQPPLRQRPIVQRGGGFRHWRFTNLPPSTSRSEEHTSELQSLMRISYAVFTLKKKK